MEEVMTELWRFGLLNHEQDVERFPYKFVDLNFSDYSSGDSHGGFGVYEFLWDDASITACLKMYDNAIGV